MYCMKILVLLLSKMHKVHIHLRIGEALVVTLWKNPEADSDYFHYFITDQSAFIL